MSQLPKAWKTVRLSDIAEVRLGRQRSPKRAQGPNMVPYLRAANVTWNGISLADVKEMDFNASEVQTYRLRSGDILLAEASGSAAEVGKPAIWRDQLPLCCFQNTLIRVRAPEEDVEYLHRHFLNDAVSGAFAASSRGVGIHHLGARSLSDWEVKLPPRPEQSRIVEALDSCLTRLDAAEAALQRAEANLKRYRASVLQAAVEGRLVPTEAELARQEGRDYEPASVLLERILAERRRRWEEAELAKVEAKGKAPKGDGWRKRYKEPVASNGATLPTLPEGWSWASLDQLTSHLTSGSRDWSPYYGQGAALFILAQNVRPMCLDLTARQVVAPPAGDPAADRSRVAEGDLLVTIVGANTGDACRVRGPLAEAFVCQSVALVRPSSLVEAFSGFLECYLNSPSGQKHFDRLMYGQGRPHLSFQDLRETPVPLPPLREIERVVLAVEGEGSIASVEALVAQSGKVQRLRQAILRWAFEGKLVEQHHDDQLAPGAAADSVQTEH
ncbi:MAG TPA: restriction endonuclease subunit S [Thermoanaerobaculia bacterium]|nr:restriction endonuclease subunit S [Thermoanaerobaculia bacterium]